MQIGFAASDPTSPSAEAQTYLAWSHWPIQCVYLRYNLGWSTGMLASNWVTEGAAADTLIVSVPMLVGDQSGTPIANSGTGQTTSPQTTANVNGNTTMTLADVAAGTWDSLFGQVFQMIADNRPAAILRIGWEQYGNGWYPWNGVGLLSAYANAYKHLVTLARTKSASFKFDWNGNQAFASFVPADAYALIGGSYVDYMTTDVYNAFDPGGVAGFNAFRDAVLYAGLALAKANGKPYGWTEFGTFVSGFANGYGDQSDWLNAAYYFLRQNQNDIAYALWFNHYAGNPAGDGGGALQRNPQMAAEFQLLFGGWQQGLGSGSRRFLSSTGTNRYR